MYFASLINFYFFIGKFFLGAPPLTLLTIHMKIFLTVFALTFPLLAQRNYPPNIPTAQKYLYKTVGDTELHLYAFMPKGWREEDKRPAVIFFFGGGWNSGSPEQFVPQCKHLASKGLIAMTADYRVKSRHGTTAKACVADARDAIIWVRENATKLGIAPDRLAAGGGSAGGHIAACLGCIDPPKKEILSSRPNALFLFNPACVLAPLDDKQAFPKERFKQLKVRMGTNPKKLSPAHHASKDDPPTIVFHGTADPTVPYATAVTFTQKLKDSGVRCELMSYEGAKHGFFNPRGGNDTVMRKTLKQLDAFLISLNWIANMSESKMQESKN